MEYIQLGATLLFIGLYAFSEFLHHADRREWREERKELLTRIQVPERAPLMDIPEPTGEMLYVPYDDDEAWNNYRKEREAGLAE
jgi:hypothetical protein